MAEVGKHSLLGKILDAKYEILSCLGQGGMGTVYKARHLHLNRDCALKVIRRQHAADPVALKRFKLEAEAASILKHPNIIEVYDFGITEDDLPYIVMELIEGLALDNVLKRHKFLHYELAIPIFMQVCDALSHAHNKRVLHRDLKPANIMLLDESDGQFKVKLVDFGIAKLLPGLGRSVDKLTLTGEIFGSPLYMSPEQCMGQSLDARSDIYALGCMLYESLTGKLPFVGDNLFQVVMMHVNQMPPSFEEVSADVAVPKEIEALVMRCLAKERSLRFPQVRDVKRELGKVYTVRQFKDSPAEISDKTNAAMVLDDNESTMSFLQSLAEIAGERNEIDLLEKLKRLEEAHGNSSPTLIAPLASLYRLYSDDYQNEKALSVKLRELQLLLLSSDLDSLELAECHEELGTTYLRLSDTASSEWHFRECLRIKSVLMAIEDFSTCKARVLLAGVLNKQGKTDDASDLLEAGLRKIYEIRGRVHFDTSEIERIAGDYYYDSLDWPNAYEHFEKAQDILIELFGNESLERRFCLMDMARCKQAVEDFKKSNELCELVIRLDNAHPRTDDPTLEHPYAVASHNYFMLADYASAEKYAIKAIEICEAQETPTSSFIAQHLDLLGDVYNVQGKYEKSTACKKRAENLRKMS